jgi:hypothetical protein
MTAFKLNNENDLVFEDGKLVFVTGAAAVRQHLQLRFQTFLGEWDFDQNLGVPWFQNILTKQTSFVVVNQILRDTILETPGVDELLEFSFELDRPTRVATLRFKALASTEIIDFSLPVEV